jgi:hypothetical protein
VVGCLYIYLAAVCVRAAIGHAQDAGTGMLQGRVDLVLEFLPVDRAPASAGASGVACLKHEVRDDAVEDAVVVVATLGQRAEIPAGLPFAAVSGRFWTRALEMWKADLWGMVDVEF